MSSMSFKLSFLFVSLSLLLLLRSPSHPAQMSLVACLHYPSTRFFLSSSRLSLTILLPRRASSTCLVSFSTWSFSQPLSPPTVKPTRWEKTTMETAEIYPISVLYYPRNQTKFIYLLQESHDIIRHFSCSKCQILWDDSSYLSSRRISSIVFLHATLFRTIISRYGINISLIIWLNNFITSYQKINHSSSEINFKQNINIQR